MGQYEPLRKHLDNLKITLTFKEIEEILGFKLPPSAYKYEAWWDNTTGNHTQRKGWIDAGWKVVERDLGKTITFQKYRDDED